jgi:mono/diheme cytochrome c family protein
MNSIRLRTLPHFFLALFLTFASVGHASAQDVGAAPAVSKEGVAPGAAAQAAPAAAAGATTGDAAAIAAGDALFKGNCAQCHAINDVVVGPALKDVHKRRPISWLIPWIKNSSKMVASGDEYAVKIFNQYQKQQMPSFALTDAEITSIVSYIAAESEKPSQVTAGGATAGNAGQVDGQETGGAAAGAGTGAGQYVDLLLIVLVVVLIVLVVTLVIIANIMGDVLKGRKDLDGRDVELLDQKFDFSKIYKSNVVRGLAVGLFVLVVLYESVQGVMAIGLDQGYQPTQPIAFSHKLHAGENQINCAYCHTSVYKSKSANIPSANICMNCHSQIKTESPEIKKIYRAIERKQPIQWVRVHNLPDLAYFNHSQHTQVGGIECQTCHGPIQNMEVVYQYSPLTMGWCINCHREQPLNTKGNGYYDNLVKLHDAANQGAAFTVSSNGGTECSKCHY